jgi:hypothetical protein
MEELDFSQVMGPHSEYINKFTRKDFMLWKFKMETMLKARELWGLVDGKDVVALSAYTKKENQALNLIM